jgi:hypothetical protein
LNLVFVTYVAHEKRVKLSFPIEWSFTYGQLAIDKLTDINDHQICPHFSPPTFIGENNNFEQNNFERNNFKRNNFERNNFERNNFDTSFEIG